MEYQIALTKEQLTNKWSIDSTTLELQQAQDEGPCQPLFIIFSCVSNLELSVSHAKNLIFGGILIFQIANQSRIDAHLHDEFVCRCSCELKGVRTERRFLTVLRLALRILLPFSSASDPPRRNFLKLFASPPMCELQNWRCESVVTLSPLLLPKPAVLSLRHQDRVVFFLLHSDI